MIHRNPVIVQISDLHFGKNTRPYRFWQSSINERAKLALKQAIVNFAPRPDFLVVTGDLANCGKVHEMCAARQYLESILNELWRARHATRCILVPGNHDVWKTTWGGAPGYFGRKDRLLEWNRVFDDWGFLAPDLPDNEGADVRPMSLLDYYCQHGGPGGGALDASEATERARQAIRACEYFPGFSVAFLKLDSNIKVKDNNYPASIARGKIGLPQRNGIQEIVHDLEMATEATGDFAAARRIALVHHHITRLPNVKQEDWMFMDDAGEVARWLARLGVRLVLHGHYHHADVVGVTYWNTETQNSKVEAIVVSAGAATALEVDDGHNSYHHIKVGYFHTEVKRPCLDNGEPQPLETAQTFQFSHKPDLEIADELGVDIPVLLEPLEASVMGEEKFADQRHIYESVKSTGFIDGDRNYFGSVELEGSNQTGQPTNFVPFVFTAVGAQYFDECECRATDLLTRKPLQSPQVQGNRPIYVFPSHIPLNEPLKPGGKFRIRVDFRLKMVMLEERDYDMISLVRFPRGVAKIEICLLSEKAIVGPLLWELRGNKLRRSVLALEKVERVPDNPANKGTIVGYTAKIDAPSALAYVLYYERLA
jgi:3',5'-cyclic AMP phosphodiesterase CpdA